MRDAIVYRASSTSTTLVERSRRHLRGRIDCANLPACPYVYVIDASGEARLAGEILRNLRSESLYASQTLLLGALATGQRTVRVRVAEQKPETTYLDSVGLRVDGRFLRPDQCQSAITPNYCVEDHMTTVLREGESLELTFTVDDDSAAAAQLEASGYYVPYGPQ